MLLSVMNDSDISVPLFVTHGRGLGCFAGEEIKSIPDVYDIQALGEGKIAFTIKTSVVTQDSTVVSAIVKDDEAFASSPKDTCKFVTDQNPCTTQGQRGDKSCFHAIVPIFSMKLVERLFLLVHCEHITCEKDNFQKDDVCGNNTSGTACSSGAEDEVPSLVGQVKTHDQKKQQNVQQVLESCHEKLKDILSKMNWEAVVNQVQLLKEHFVHHRDHEVPCINEDTCPGSKNKRASRERVHNKRNALLVHPLSGVTGKRKMDCTAKDKLSYLKQGKFEMGKDVKRTSEMKHVMNFIEDSCNTEESENDVGNGYKVYGHNFLSECKVNIPQRNCSSKWKSDFQDKFPVIQTSNQNSEFTDIVKKKQVEVSHKKEDELMRADSANIHIKSVSDIDKQSGTLSTSVRSDHEKPIINFRVSCRISGQYKQVITKNWLLKNFISSLRRVNNDWTTEWRNPVLDFYVNVTDYHFIIGISLTPEPLSLRRYIPHLTLRSTICHLMATLVRLTPRDVLLDPMCGGGTILLQASKSYKVQHVIGSDISGDQLEVARCNLQSISIPFSLIKGSATRIPLHDGAVSAVVCDFPFGQKHKMVSENNGNLLKAVLLECQRVLNQGGRAAFLLSTQQEKKLKELISEQNGSESSGKQKSDIHMGVEGTHFVSLGETSACIVVLHNQDCQETWMSS